MIRPERMIRLWYNLVGFERKPDYMNFECPKCQAPISPQGQRFCNRCGQDLHAYYESRGIGIPIPPGESTPANLAPAAEEAQTLEMNSSIAQVNQERPANNQTVVIEPPE